VRINLLTALRYARGNRAAIASHEGYVDYNLRCAETYNIPGLVQKAKQAGPCPEEPGSGWRYDFKRRPVHDKLLIKYRLDEIVEQGSTIECALRLMGWLTAHSCYNGMEIRACFLFQGRRETGDRLLRYTYNGGFARALNCRHKAMVLADLCMACGIAALPVELQNLPCNHFVVQVWLPEERRWVMLDPSFNSYITDEAGRALNLIEIKRQHCAGKEMHVAQYDLNGTQDCRGIYLNDFILGPLLHIMVDGAKRTATELLAKPNI